MFQLPCLMLFDCCPGFPYGVTKGQVWEINSAEAIELISSGWWRRLTIQEHRDYHARGVIGPTPAPAATLATPETKQTPQSLAVCQIGNLSLWLDGDILELPIDIAVKEVQAGRCRPLMPEEYACKSELMEMQHERRIRSH
jgi:hypothetical protein